MINIDCVIIEGGIIEATISKDLTIDVELIGSGPIGPKGETGPRGLRGPAGAVRQPIEPECESTVIWVDTSEEGPEIDLIEIKQLADYLRALGPVRLLFDYNTDRIDVAQEEVTIAMIQAKLLNDNNFNGHLQLTYNSTEDTELTIRIKDNAVSELFTPLHYKIKTGKGSIGIPHAYLDKYAGIHTLTATAQVTNGSLYFDTRSIIYTVDGAFLVGRDIIIDMDLCDIALKRTEDDEEPPEIYAIGLVDGRATVKVAENKDYIDDVIWETIEILGEAIECAIEFDGDWTKIVGQYRFETEEKPWAFWIDNNNILWGQHLLDNSTKIELSNEVVKLTAVKGYRNIIFTDMDQGLVVMYIKEDGLVYYRSRIFASEGIYVWDNEILVTEFTKIATAIRSFRTNDYRIGFIIEDTDGISTMLLTDRNWAGIAIGSEKIIAYPYEIHLDLIDLDYENTYEDIHLQANPYDIKLDLLFGSTENSILIAENTPITKLDENEEEYDDWGWVIEFEVQNPIPELLLEKIVVTDTSNSSTIPIASIENLGDNKYRLTTSNVIESGFNNVLGDIKIDITNVINEAGYTYENMSYTFTPVNLEPTDIPVPEVVEVWNE